MVINTLGCLSLVTSEIGVANDCDDFGICKREIKLNLNKLTLFGCHIPLRLVIVGTRPGSCHSHSF